MVKSGKKDHLSRVLSSHIAAIYETFKMLESPADSRLDKVEWSEVIKLGDQVSKHATMTGMLWSGDSADVKELESNMGAYCNVLNGFLLLCHASTVGAGPTLQASIKASAKEVMECSFLLLKEAVSSCVSNSSNRKQTIPQLSGSVWEACTALKKTPTTNYMAIGRAITQVAVSVKDILREMNELKTIEGPGARDGPSDSPWESLEDENSCDNDLDDDLSPEEMAIAKLATNVVSETLAVLKEIIRLVSNLSKSSKGLTAANEHIDSIEKLLSYCQEIENQANELGASVYPPQEIAQMKSITKAMYDTIHDKVRKEVGSIEQSPEAMFGALDALEWSLGKLEDGLGCSNHDISSKLVDLAV